MYLVLLHLLNIILQVLKGNISYKKQCLTWFKTENLHFISKFTRIQNQVLKKLVKQNRIKI